MFAPSVDHQKRHLLYFDGMMLVHGYGVRSRTKYVKFCEDGEWHYLSAFPLYCVFLHFGLGGDRDYLRSSSCDYFYDHCYRCFKSLFDFGHYDGKGVPLRRRKRNVYLHAISSYSRWYDHVNWVNALSKLEGCLKQLAEFLG